jgi:hypothetical protein
MDLYTTTASSAFAAGDASIDRATASKTGLFFISIGSGFVIC